MVLLPGCVCCQGSSCVFPTLNSYAVEVGGMSSWDFRCGRPAGTTSSTATVLKSSSTSQCGLVGGIYTKFVGSFPRERYSLGPVTISESGFQFGNTSQSTESMLGANYGPDINYANLWAGIQLDLNYTKDATSGLMSWNFRASAALGSSAKRWRDITSFYSQTLESLRCVQDSSLACCGDDFAFHLPTPTTFSFTNSGVTVDIYGVSNTLYEWTANFGSDASDFNGTPSAVITKHQPCFQNCNYATNLCCNPLP